jgi:hypothetical protein
MVQMGLLAGRKKENGSARKKRKISHCRTFPDCLSDENNNDTGHFHALHYVLSRRSFWYF